MSMQEKLGIKSFRDANMCTCTYAPVQYLGLELVTSLGGERASENGFESDNPLISRTPKSRYTGTKVRAERLDGQEKEIASGALQAENCFYFAISGRVT